MKRSPGELLLERHLEELGIPFESEKKFHPTRKWRMDFVLPEHCIGIEVEGGTWSGGRHTRGNGYANDLEKYNAATLLGWRLLRFTTAMVNDGTAIETIKEAL